MKSYYLKQTGANAFSVIEHDTKPVVIDGKETVDTRVSFQKDNLFLEVAAAVLVTRFGVEKKEVEFALEQFEELGHNIAHFGWMGGFIYSEFEGILN